MTDFISKEEQGFCAYYLWQCCPSTELKGYGDHFDGGCYLWQVRWSSIKVTQKVGIQQKCKSCKRRPRNYSHHVEHFNCSDEAQNEADKRNINEQGYPLNEEAFV